MNLADAAITAVLVVPALAAVLLAFFMKLATVSLGCAPLLSQYLARSRSKVKLFSFFRG